MVAIFVIHNPILFESLGLVGEQVIWWVVGLVLIPLGQPGGGLDGEACSGALAL